MPSKRNVILSVLTRVVVTVVLLGIGVALFALLVTTRVPPASTEEDVLRPHVAVIQVQTVPVRRQFEGFGTAEAFRTVNVPAQVRGVVENLPEDIVAGNFVERGQLLVQLDASDYVHEVDIRTEQLAEIDAQIRRLDVELRAALRRIELAQQEVALAEADLQRVLRAQETAGATQREVDQQRQQLAARQREEVATQEALDAIEPRRAQLQANRGQAESSLQLARRILERTTITSPADGVLQSVNVDLGESIQADQTVARIVDLQRIDIPIRLPSSARPYLATGNEVLLSPAANNETKWRARIARIAPEDDQATRTVTVYVEFRQDPAVTNTQPLLSPGQFVRARVEGAAEEERQVIPRRALLADRVRLVEGGIVRSKRVEVAYQVRGLMPELGVTDDHWLVLREPLNEGALVVLEAARRIADGTKVEPRLATAEPAPNAVTLDGAATTHEQGAVP